MKKLLFCLIAASLSLANVSVAGDGLNPQFLKWRKMKAAGKLPAQREAAQKAAAKTRKVLRSGVPDLPTADDGEVGMVPDAVSLDYLVDAKKSVGLKPWSDYPSRYDLREHGRVTAVRNQGKFPTCWAFGTYGALESAILSARPEDAEWGSADIDFSEKHLVDNHGFDLSLEMGGSMAMSMAYMLRWCGPVSEAAVPYPAAGATIWTPGDVQPAPRLHVQQVRWLPGRTSYTENDDIKANIMELGGVYATFYMATKNGDANWLKYWRASTAAYYCTAAKSINHGVAIIGWDDNYPRSNFSTMPPGDGAYLVKNSWGADWGAQGFFWVSYYDRNFAMSTMAVFNGVESKANYATKYEYDELGHTGSHSGNSFSGSAWAANVFTATNDDQIAAVGFYALAPDTRYTIRVRKGLPDMSPASGGTIVSSATKEGTVSYAGFYTVPLENVVSVSAGERFSVEVCLYSPGLKTPLAYEAPVPGLTSRASSAAGQSWYSAKGSSWTDLSKKISGANFCIKAYGIGTQDPEEHLDARRPVAIEVVGPRTLAAGATGEFAATLVFDDGSRMGDGLDIDAEVTDGGTAVADYENVGNVLRVTLADSITADTLVKLRFSFDWEETIAVEVAFTATQSAPAAPMGLDATQGAATSGVRLSWGAVENAASYSIYRSGSGDVATAVFLTTTEESRYTDQTATPGVDYTYFVKAQNTTGTSAFSNGASGWRALAAPQNLAATDGDYDHVLITWDASEGANTYCVWRAEDMDDDGNPVAPVQLGGWSETTSLRDTPPVKGKTYFYWVKASLSLGGWRSSEWSIFDEGSRFAPVTLASVAIVGPETVSAGSEATYTLDAVLSDGTRLSGVSDVSWSSSLGGDSANGASFAFEAKVDGLLVSSNTLVAVTGAWTHHGADGDTVKSDTKYVVIAPVVPARPNAVKVLSASEDGLALGWEEVEGASSYNLYRGETAESAVLLTSSAMSGFEDRTAMPGVEYRYYLEAVNAAGASERSEASVAAMRRFTPPSYVTASNGKSTEAVTVAWRAVTGAKFYRVSRADSADGGKRDLSGWIADRTYIDSSATPGVTYWYFVEAAYTAEGGSASAYSAPTIGSVSAAQTLAFLQISGPAAIQYDGEGSYICEATYANGVRRRVNPAWSFKTPSALVTVDAAGIVRAGHVTGEDLHLELQASYTDNGVAKTDSFAVTVLAYKPAEPKVDVSNVVVRARWPWNGKVDITYDLYSSPATTRALVTVSGYDHDLNRTLQAATLEGDGVSHPAAGGAPHVNCRVTWDLGADYENFHASAFSVALDAAPFAVAPPANFRASDGTSTNAVELAWEEAFGAVEYEIWRSLSNNPEDAERIAVTNATGYSDVSAVPGETYHYWIKTVAGEFEEDVSGFSAPATGRRAAPPQSGGGSSSINLSDGLVAYYPFDGDMLDKSGNDRHLTGWSKCYVHASSGIVFDNSELSRDDCNTFVPGYDGDPAHAFAFGGFGTGLYPADSFTVASNFTFACWVRTECDFGRVRDVNIHTNVLGRAGFYNSVLAGEHFTNGMAACGLNIGTNGISITEGSGVRMTLPAEYRCDLGTNWHHVAFTVNGGGALTLYLDGVHVCTGVDSGNAKCVNIGHLGPGNPLTPTYDPQPEILIGINRHFAGVLDEVCIYGRALSLEEVAALYENGKPNVAGKAIAASPEFSVAEGDGTATVTITCADADATIYYSIARTDGGETVDSREYTVPFAVNGDATVTAWSVKEGCYNSPRVTREIKTAWKAQVKRALTDDGALDWETSSDAPWMFDPAVTSDGGAGSMRSGRIGANGVSTMTATITGEGTLAFDWKVSSEAEQDFLSVSVDGETFARISGERNWDEVVIPLTNDASHVVVWTYAKDNSVNRGSDCGWVDYVTWAPAGSSVAMPSATVAPIGEGASNTVALVCQTPNVELRYRLSTHDDGDGEWVVYEGPFVVVGDATLHAKAFKAGYVDSPTYTTAIRRPWIVRVTQALVADDVTKNALAFSADWYEYGIDEEYWWDDDRDTVSDGGFSSLRSANVGDDEATSIFATFSGAGTLSFDWKVSSESGWDVLTYFGGEDGADYAYAEAISGERNWERVSIVFTGDAEHVMEWEYSKDDAGGNGDDAGWIDALKWTPARYVPAAPAARRGYVFKGYAGAEGGEAVYKPGAMLDALDGTATFFPVWSPIRYVVRYVATPAEEGLPTEQTFAYDETKALLPASGFVFAPAHEFAGWSVSEHDMTKVWSLDAARNLAEYSDGEQVVNLADEEGAVVTLHPVLKSFTYVERFLEADGVTRAAADIVVTNNTTYVLPNAYPRDGYTFDGWNADTSDGFIGNEVPYPVGQRMMGYYNTPEGYVHRYFAVRTAIPSSNGFGPAVEQPELDFTTGGDAPWFVQSATVHSGTSALQSGALAANGVSTLETVIVTNMDRRISFWWKVSSEEDCDKLAFGVNGATIAEISGEKDWAQVTATLPAGTNVLKWTYSKDSGGDMGQDCGWIDDLSFGVVVVSNKTVYVDASRGSDETGDGSSAKPFATIQMGIDCAPEGGTVNVLPGRYGPIVSHNKQVNVVAVGGTEQTFIDGMMYGTNRCATLTDKTAMPTGADLSQTKTILRFFTLMNGADTTGSGVGGGVRGGTLFGCVLKYNYARNGAAACESRLYNCLVCENSADDISGASILRGCVLYGCTVSRNMRNAQNGYDMLNGVAYNSIVWGNLAFPYSSGNTAATRISGSSVNSMTTVDPKFVDVASGNYRLTSSSPAIDAGTNLYAVTGLDLDRTARVKGACVDLGCYEFEGTPQPEDESTAVPTFTVEQWAVSKPLYGIPDAWFVLTNRAYVTARVTGQYEKLALLNDKGARSYKRLFEDEAIPFPMAWNATNTMCLVSGRVEVSEAGVWSFYTGYSGSLLIAFREVSSPRNYEGQYVPVETDATVRRWKFTFPRPGLYDAEILYCTSKFANTPQLSVGCLKGNPTSPNSQIASDYKNVPLFGTPESGMTLVNDK